MTRTPNHNQNRVAVAGEIVVILNALGCHQGDDPILDAIALVGPDMKVEEFDFDGEKSTHFIFKSSGTDFVFEDDILVSVMMRTQPDNRDGTYGLYPRPAKLINGLPAAATRSEVASSLGTPERVGNSFDRYESNGRYIHFEFDSHEQTAMISTLLEAV